ncbi:polysaccharide biosynthesis tyrosine autokinase [Echinicola jeungdonensis]|uniref:non-specific protein-tyrosine kinase n=1 Tax=Echinicola jeungdonensis TaxID=709343 RepID=A0ABV5J097_9BACT|nr:tyrosine-protein kinase [Echinicola jeungdonensis]MDN3671147.1 polysaccharide biosynthesis tyrosine autokinase [Echinicola jeungdonensis]
MKLIPKNNSEDYLEESSSMSFNLKDLFLRYLKYWPYFLLSMVLALGAAYMANKFVHPQYKVDSKFLIKEEASNMDILDLTGLAEGNFRSYNRTSNEAIMFKAKPMAEDALRRLDFDVEYYENGPFIPTEIYNKSPIKVEVDWKHPQMTGGFISISWNSLNSYTLKFNDDSYTLHDPTGSNLLIENPNLIGRKFPFDKWIETEQCRIKVVLLNSNQQNGDYSIKIRPMSSLVGQFTGENLQVWPINPAGSVLGISLVCKNPQKGIDYLNKLMDVFLEQELKEKNRLASNTVDFIDSQISGVADSLVFIENRLQNFRSRNKTYNIGTEGSTMFSHLSELETALSQEKFKKEYYQNLKEYLVREDYNEIVMPSGLGIEDPILNSLIENLITMQTEKSRLLSTQTEASPAVREVNRKIRDLNGSVKEVLINVDKNADLVIRNLENRIAKIEEEFSRLPLTEQNLLRIQRQFAINESIYTFLLQRRAESAIAMASNTTSNKVVEYAGPGAIPITLPYMTNFVMGGFAGFAIPFVIITLFYAFNQKIKNINDTEKKLAAPLLSQIGHNRFKSNLVVLKEPSSGITEAFRALKTNIHFISPKEKQVTIAITSSISGEGKTFCAINLASTFSLNNKKTILIGCDMRKPKIFGDFNIKNNIGLSSYLSQQNENLSEIIQPSKYKNLDLLLAGPTPPNPAELLVNKHFEKLIQKLELEYDVVILDTPPIGLVSETLEILHLVDLTVFILRHNFSKKSFVNEVNNLKNKMGIKNIYTVLNDIARKDMNYGGYGYGYYKEDRNRKSLFNRIIGNSHRNVGI